MKRITWFLLALLVIFLLGNVRLVANVSNLRTNLDGLEKAMGEQNAAMERKIASGNTRVDEEFAVVRGEIASSVNSLRDQDSALGRNLADTTVILRSELKETTADMRIDIASVNDKFTKTTEELTSLARETSDQDRALGVKFEKMVNERTIDTARLFEKTAGSIVVVKTKQSLGTGFAYGGTNRVVTAYHVVDDGSPITVMYTSGLLGEFGVDATIIKQANGVAILELNSTGGMTSLKASSDITTGEPIMVIGNPYYMGLSVSVGVVSGIGRRRALLPDVDQIQVDASITPGLSGSPVLNRKGEVIGVVNSVLEDGSFGFAIPIEYIDRLLGP